MVSAHPLQAAFRLFNGESYVVESKATVCEAADPLIDRLHLLHNPV